MRRDSGGLLCVDRHDLAGLADGLLDCRILTVAVRELAMPFKDQELVIGRNIHIVERNVAVTERGRRDGIHVVNGSFTHVDVELLQFIHWVLRQISCHSSFPGFCRLTIKRKNLLTEPIGEGAGSGRVNKIRHPWHIQRGPAPADNNLPRNTCVRSTLPTASIW